MGILHNFWYNYYSKKTCSLAEILHDIEFNPLCPASVAHQILDEFNQKWAELFKDNPDYKPIDRIQQLQSMGLLPYNSRLKRRKNELENNNI